MADLDWFHAIDRYGVLVAFNIVLIYALWRFSVFMGPKITDVTAAHLNLVATMDKNLPEQTGILRDIQGRLSDHGKILADIRAAGGNEIPA